MRKFLISIILIFVFAFVSGIGFLYFRFAAMRGVAINDVRQAKTIVLRTKTKDALVHGIAIRGCGHIDGKANIHFMFEGKPYKTVKLSGKIDFEWRGEWYSDTAEIRYEPTHVRSGRLMLGYRFDY